MAFKGSGVRLPSPPPNRRITGALFGRPFSFLFAEPCLVVASQANHIANAFTRTITRADLLLVALVAAQNASAFDPGHQTLFVGLALPVVLTALRLITLNALVVFAA